MYTSHTILDFNIICIFEFAFKRMIASFCILFIVIKTQIINLILIILIDLISNIFICFSFITYFIIFLEVDFVHCLFNHKIALVLSVKFISGRVIMPAVISRYSFKGT